MMRWVLLAYLLLSAAYMGYCLIWRDKGPAERGGSIVAGALNGSLAAWLFWYSGLFA